ncbi:uncharacterized protein [Lolium perenne]|uniref:uncharacterized protein n=1 Tax=Lolium perenne TaxID=4522 RepID=UPI003A9A0DCB
MAFFPPLHVVEDVLGLLQLLSDGAEYTYPPPTPTPPPASPSFSGRTSCRVPCAKPAATYLASTCPASSMDGLQLLPMLVNHSRRDGPGKSVELMKFQGQDHGFLSVEPYGNAGSEVVCLKKWFDYVDR